MINIFIERDGYAVVGYIVLLEEWIPIIMWENFFSWFLKFVHKVFIFGLIAIGVKFSYFLNYIELKRYKNFFFMFQNLKQLYTTVSPCLGWLWIVRFMHSIIFFLFTPLCNFLFILNLGSADLLSACIV